MIRPLRKDAAAALDLLTRDLVDPCMDDGRCSRRYDNCPGSYLPLCVERIGPCRYSIAHYFEQNGDLVPDPDIEIVKAPDGRWFPAAVTLAFGGHRVALQCDDRGNPQRVARREYNGLRDLCQMMLRNAIEQQGLAGSLRAWKRREVTA